MVAVITQEVLGSQGPCLLFLQLMMCSAAGDPGGDKRALTANTGMIDWECGHAVSLTS
jgi:hypothetical protein